MTTTTWQMKTGDRLKVRLAGKTYNAVMKDTLVIEGPEPIPEYGPDTKMDVVEYNGVPIVIAQFVIEWNKNNTRV